jgi:hypothetical protein
MWAFRQFPDYLYYQQDRPDAPFYEVEVLGYYGNSNPVNSSVELVGFREICRWIHVEIGDIHFLPVAEFEKKFSRFGLKEIK